jgi:site-specific recombinase XerD
VAIAGDIPGPLADWWDDFARSLRRRGRSEATARIYGQSYTRFWIWALGEGLPADPAAVSTAYVNRWVDSLRDTIAPATVSVYWRNLRPFFSWWAKETGQPNPFAGADVPSVELEPPDVIHLDDIRALLETCKGKEFVDRRDNAVIRVLFDTGCRRGELVNLTVGDWDRRQDFLTLRGKTGLRVVPISAATGEALARYVRARSSHPAAGRTEALWLGRKGALRDSGISQLLLQRCRQAGLPRINPHAFRHTFSHEFRAQGGSEGDLMYLAGWKTTAMAHRYGASAAAQRAREAHRRIGLGDKL